ncbi:CoA-binding protein [Candidatus Bathyarchaeota archaeon]|nr:CoA-binding protein [Candidatus Bathyarchaeota archaeon]
MKDADLREILKTPKVVAVVGVSRDPSKDSHRVAEYLKSKGFTVVPINPFVNEVLGERAYKSLLDAPEDVQKTIEIVDVFRPSDEVEDVVKQAVQLKNRYGLLDVFWMQLGIVNEHAADLARKAGIAVVMDECIMQQHKRLFGA